MKIKVDFVTNSSSSSFLVAWPKKIETINDVLKFIHEKEKASVVYHDAMDQEPIQLEEGSFDYDFDSATKVITEKLADFLEDGYVADIRFDCYDISNRIRNQVRDRLFYKKNNLNFEEWKTIDDETEKIFISKYGMSQIELQHKLAVELATKFIKLNKGKWLYMFHYSDEDGAFYSELEHGGTFDSLQNIQVSKH